MGTISSIPIVCHTVGQDFLGTSQALTFLPGISQMCTSFLTILGDDIIEPNERILITLTTANTDIVIGGSTFVTVLDDDREFPVPFVMGLPPHTANCADLAKSQAEQPVQYVCTPLVVHM